MGDRIIMSNTVSKAIADARRIIPELAYERALELAQLVDREILSIVPDLRRTSATDMKAVTVAPTAPEVPLPATMVSVARAVVQGVNQYRLVATTVSALDRDVPYWRTVTSAKLEKYYVFTNEAGSAMVGFAPRLEPGVPSVQVHLWGETVPSESDFGASNLSPLLPSTHVYTMGIVYYASMELRPEIFQAAKAVYEEEIAKTKAYVEGRAR